MYKKNIDKNLEQIINVCKEIKDLEYNEFTQGYELIKKTISSIDYNLGLYELSHGLNKKQNTIENAYSNLTAKDDFSQKVNRYEKIEDCIWIGHNEEAEINLIVNKKKQKTEIAVSDIKTSTVSYLNLDIELFDFKDKTKNKNEIKITLKGHFDEFYNGSVSDKYFSIKIKQYMKDGWTRESKHLYYPLFPFIDINQMPISLKDINDDNDVEFTTLSIGLPKTNPYKFEIHTLEVFS